MKQNIFDIPEFFAAYQAYRQDPLCLNSTIEQPTLWSMLPELRNQRVLDIGCGRGEFLAHSHQHGASVVGLDISRRMCEVARQRTLPFQNIEIICQAIEDAQFAKQSFDLVISSLCLHYVQAIHPVVDAIHSWLRPGGTLLFSCNHPVYTATLGSNNDHLTEQLNYWREGPRPHKWFIGGVVKYHRTLQTLCESLRQFSIKRIVELSPKAVGVTHWSGDPGLSERPIFIAFECRKL